MNFFSIDLGGDGDGPRSSSDHLAHELRTPLNAIIGYAEMLQEEVLQAGHDRYIADLQKIHLAAHQLLTRVNQLFLPPGPTAEIIVAGLPVDHRPSRPDGAVQAGRQLSSDQGPSSPTIRRARVLVVDDNGVNRDLLCRQLERQGHFVESADRGERAIEMLRSGRFDLMFLDIMMPDLDGYQVLERIKSDSKLRDVTVLMVSALDQLQSVERCLELGAEDYLFKPIHHVFLNARVGACLEKKRCRDREAAYLRQAERERDLQDQLATRRLVAEMQKERLQALGQMVAGVAHEINTPLGILATAASVIERGLASLAMTSAATADPELAVTLADVQEASLLMKNSIGRAARLVRSFRNLSIDEVNEGNQELDLHAAVLAIVDFFRISARKTRLSIAVIDALPATSRTWSGYEGHLSQVILNLLTNVQRYAYENGNPGTIEITLSMSDDRPDARFVITIRDFGRGIAPEQLPRVFDAFYTTGRGIGGTGLGLTLVYNIVTTALQGTIAIASEVGQGTTVTLTLPQKVQPRVPSTITLTAEK